MKNNFMIVKILLDVTFILWHSIKFVYNSFLTKNFRGILETLAN